MKAHMYSSRELSAFCMQISLLLKAAVPLEEGLSIMAEDAHSEDEKMMLSAMAEDVELGDPFFAAMERTSCFPSYAVRMAKLGQQTGALDQLMEDLANYYEKEDMIMRNVRNAVTYPVMMAGMLLVVLFVLFTKVIPVFAEVYAQLGVQMSSISRYVFRFGGVLSGAALCVFGLILGIVLLSAGLSARGYQFLGIERIKAWIKERSRIAAAVASYRFTSVLALTLRSGMELEKGMELAQELADHKKITLKLQDCLEKLEQGMPYYEALKETELFQGFHVQMIKVGNRSGHLDEVMRKISEDYEQQADQCMEKFISGLEPVLVAVLSIAVGLVLLSVMLPLAGVLAGIG